MIIAKQVTDVPIGDAAVVVPAANQRNLLAIENLVESLPVRGGIMKRITDQVKAVVTCSHIEPRLQKVQTGLWAACIRVS